MSNAAINHKSLAPRSMKDGTTIHYIHPDAIRGAAASPESAEEIIRGGPSLCPQTHYQDGLRWSGNTISLYRDGLSLAVSGDEPQTDTDDAIRILVTGIERMMAEGWAVGKYARSPFADAQGVA